MTLDTYTHWIQESNAREVDRLDEEIPEVKEAQTRPTKMPNALTFDPVYNYGIKDPHFVLGPKIPEANEYHTIIASETQRMLAGEMTPAETAASLQQQLDDLNGA